MDPNFIHMDWERTFDAIMLVAVIAIVIERALSVLFQNRLFIERFEKDGMKETIAFVVSVAVCAIWKLDAVSMIVLTQGKTTALGYVLTGGLVAGGCKGSLKLFQDFFGLQSTAFKMRHSIEASRAAADAEKAQSEAEAAPNKQAAEIANAKATVAVKKVKDAAAKAAADGKVVPSETLTKAEGALARASAAVDSKPS